MSKIDVIIYTKNRACQLDLLLRSIRDKFKSVNDVHVLYTYSNDSFCQGYNIIQNTNYELNLFWKKEESFSADTRDILRKMVTPCFLSLCDDDVFVNDVTIEDTVIKLLHENTYNAFSLKAGLNITHNYPNYVLTFPKFVYIEPNILSWRWLEQPPEVDWGYPTCTNALIFEVRYYLELIKDIIFNQTATLEGGLNEYRKYQPNLIRPGMLCHQYSSLLNIPVNRQQTVVNNTFGATFPATAEELNDKFLSGKKILTDNIYGHRIFMPNEELPFIFGVLN